MLLKIRSPVMEMFQLIALNEFKGFSGTNNEIIILSDMIQNTDGISMYQNNLPSFSKFKKSEYFSKVKTNLSKNVSIKLLIIKEMAQEKCKKINILLIFGTILCNGNKAEDFKITLWMDSNGKIKKSFFDKLDDSSVKYAFALLICRSICNIFGSNFPGKYINNSTYCFNDGISLRCHIFK